MTSSFTYICTLEDHKKLEYLISPLHSKSGKVIFIAFLFLLFLLSIYFVYSFFVRDLQPLLFVAYFVFLLIPILFIIRFVHINNVIEENFKICHKIGEFTFTINDEKIEARNKYFISSLSWSEITQVLENKYYYSFIIGRIARISIPKHILSTDAISIINSQIESNKLSRKIVKE